MNFDYPGYPLKFVQRDKCNDGSNHLYTYIYKFFSPVTNYYYIVRAEYHKYDVFAIKFYCKKDRGSEFKYSKIVNKGDIGNILMTCARVIPLLLRKNPNASFGFAASRSIDKTNQTVEDYIQTQRYRLYKYMIPLKFGYITFNHVAYNAISCYLLYNKGAVASQTDIEKMFRDTYENLHNIDL